MPALLTCGAMKRAGTLKVSKSISAAFSRFISGFKGASVSNTYSCVICTDKSDFKLKLTSPAAAKPRHYTANTHTYRMFFRRHIQLVPRIKMTPNPLHVLPIHHHPMLHRIAPPKSPPMFLQLASHAHVRPLQRPAWHHADVLGPPDRRGENDPRPVATRKAGLEDARTIVNHDGLVCNAVHALTWSQKEGNACVELGLAKGQRRQAWPRRGAIESADAHQKQRVGLRPCASDV